MSLIFVDVSATSMAWFRGALIELSDNVNVKFLFSDIKKYKEEVKEFSNKPFDENVFPKQFLGFKIFVGFSECNLVAFE